MSASKASTIGLVLCLAPAVVHGLELVSPMLSRLTIQYILPFFGGELPSSSSAITYSEQLLMIDAARIAGPLTKRQAAEDYAFLLLFDQRQAGIAFTSIAAGVLYALGLPLALRAPLHLPVGVMSALFSLVNANQAGLFPFGHHPRVSKHGKKMGLALAPFWGVAAFLNLYAFTFAGVR
jgi:hypothetical protein